jgi:hypothetical protein
LVILHNSGGLASFVGKILASTDERETYFCVIHKKTELAAEVYSDVNLTKVKGSN